MNLTLSFLMKAILLGLLLASSAGAQLSIKQVLQLDTANPENGFTSTAFPNAARAAISGDYLATTMVDDGSFNFVLLNVVIHKKINGIWTEIQTLTQPDYPDAENFGMDLDFSEDGRLLVIGAVATDSVIGGAYVYRKNPSSGLFEFVQKLTPASAITTDDAGSQVAISGDWIAVASPEDDDIGSNDGSVTLFELDESTSNWVQRQQLFPSTSNGVRWGIELDLEGNILAIAGRSNDTYLDVFHLDSTTRLWVHEFALSSEDSASGRVQPDVSGNRIIERQQCCSNLVRVWERVGANGIPVPDGTAWMQLGSTLDNQSSTTLALEGDIALVFDFPELDVFCFQDANPNPDWISIAQLPTAIDFFGSSIETKIDGNTVIQVENIGPEVSEYRTTVLEPDYSLLVERVKDLLFFGEAPAGEENNAAFAYQTRLYENDGTLGFITRHDRLTAEIPPGNQAIVSQINYDNAQLALDLVDAALPTADPQYAEQLKELRLDIAYGAAALELILAKNVMRGLGEERLSGVSAGLFFIDQEISRIEEALAHSTTGLNHFFDLFGDDLGLPATPQGPAGRQLYGELVPGRELSASFTPNPSDNVPDPLLTGYKDLVLFYELLVQHCRTAVDLAFLKIAEADGDDNDEVRELIGDTQRLVFEQRLQVESLFDPALLDDTLRDSLGLTSLSNSLDAALSDLAAFESNLNGTINLLGYEPDFLMLIDNNGANFDSYDNFKDLLEHTVICTPGAPPTGNAGTSRLGIAVRDQCQALFALGNYNRNQDALESEFSSSTTTIRNRLVEIVGVDPISDPLNYETPEDNVGSEIYQQFISIEAARLRIERNSVEISNLNEKVRIEVERRARENEINSEISDLVVEYGDKQAKITEKIGYIQAGQEAADGIAKAFTNPKAAVANVINGFAQGGAEIAKAHLEGDKEQLAAEEDAAIRDKENELAGVNSLALIDTWMLEMNTLLIDSQESVLLLRQEAGRLAGLYCEQAALERRLDEVDTMLAARSFASPTHRLRALSATLTSEIAYADALKWLFFLTRAAEYKWNTEFTTNSGSPDDEGWNINDLFKMRNADELQAYFEALALWESFQNIGRPLITPDPEDWFSLREDYFGFEQTTDDVSQTVLKYDAIDPSDGMVKEVDGITAFRFALQALVEEGETLQDPDQLVIPFDTVRRTDFRTTTQTFGGSFFDPDNYLDRIDSIKIFVRGPHQQLAYLDPPTNTMPVDGENELDVELTYAGTSFIRNQSPGVVLDPVNAPNRLTGEFTSYPARFFRSSAGPTDFEFSDSYTFNSAKALKVTSDRFRSTLEALSVPAEVNTFRERSVASTSWVLTLVLDPLSGESDARLAIDEIDDIEFFIVHKAVQR
ncbi:MAG: FG-GAP repeat protein [Verrucomicrobiota bacterium]